MSIIFAAGRYSFPIYRVSPNWGNRQGIPYMVWKTSKMKGGDTFLVRLGIQGV